MELTEAEKGYLAGLIDGEGCINIAKSQGRYYVLQVITAQTNEYMLDHWQKKTGIGTLHHMKKRTNDKAERWHWHCGNHDAIALLEIIQPHLVLKCEEARVALEFAQVCGNQQKQFRGKGKPRLTADMLAVREMYKQTLHRLKRQRNGAELERPLEVEYTLPHTDQMCLL